MANQPPVRHVLRSSASIAERVRRDVVAAPISIDPTDMVMAAYPRMADYGCVALVGVPCAESVLRLAFTHANLEGFTPSSMQQGEMPIPLSTRVGNLAMPALLRRLSRMSLQDFPVYTLPPPSAGEEFILVSGVPRKDHWCILFVPADPPGMPNPHWTFTTYVVPVKPRVRVPRPMVLYTDFPQYDLPDNVFWRCERTFANASAASIAYNTKRGCSCNPAIVCIHEARFLASFPQAITVSLGSVGFYRGGYHATIASASTAGDTRLSFATNRRANITVGQASFYLQDAWGFGLSHYGRPVEILDEFLVSLPPYQLRCIRYATPTRLSVPFFLTSLAGWFSAYHARLDVFRVTDFSRFPRFDSVKSSLRSFFYPFLGRLSHAAVRIYDYVLPPVSVPIRDTIVLPSVVPPPFPVREMFLRRAAVSVWRFAFGSRMPATTVVNKPIELPTMELDVMRHVPVTDVDMRGLRIVLLAAATAALGYASYTLVRDYLLRGWVPMSAATVPRPFGHHADLNMSIRELDKVSSRLAIRATVERDVAVDALRRAYNEHQWPVLVTPAEAELWIQSVVQQEGRTVNYPRRKSAFYCVTCQERPPKRYGECRICIHARRRVPPEMFFIDFGAVHVGRVGLWSRDFRPPLVELKEDVRIFRGNKRKSHGQDVVYIEYKTYQDVLRRKAAEPPVPTCRGFNAGPMILSHVPECYAYGPVTALVAFCVRLGIKRLHEPRQDVYDFLYCLLSTHSRPEFRIEEIAVEDEVEFLSHFSGKKLVKMLEAKALVDNGYGPSIERGHELCMKGFTKAEKHYKATFIGDGSFHTKPVDKPRFICCPSPEFLFTIGPYTHAQTKWLSKKFGPNNRMFYAGCSTPEELNDWLNWTLHEGHAPFSLADDITAIDSNHNRASFDLHTKVRHLQFPGISEAIEALFCQEHTIRVRIKEFIACVSYVNASGVSDTSYKNSLLCIYIRWLALAHAIRPLSFVAQEIPFLCDVLNCSFMSAAGDDGLIRCPRVMFGTDLMSSQALQRYRDCWSFFGFSVKLAAFPEHRWRMATYLACRPVWDGHSRYVFAPEPARRLKGLFWQLDCPMHPTAWARGVTSQLLGMSRNVPVLSHICVWYLSQTSGPIAPDVSTFHDYSVWRHYLTDAVYNERAEREFCLDYHVERSDIDRFLRVLFATTDVYVNLGGFVLERIYCEES